MNTYMIQLQTILLPYKAAIQHIYLSHPQYTTQSTLLANQSTLLTYYGQSSSPHNLLTYINTIKTNTFCQSSIKSNPSSSNCNISPNPCLSLMDSLCHQILTYQSQPYSQSNPQPFQPIQLQSIRGHLFEDSLNILPNQGILLPDPLALFNPDHHDQVTRLCLQYNINTDGLKSQLIQDCISINDYFYINSHKQLSPYKKFFIYAHSQHNIFTHQYIKSQIAMNIKKNTYSELQNANNITADLFYPSFNDFTQLKKVVNPIEVFSHHTNNRHYQYLLYYIYEETSNISSFDSFYEENKQLDQEKYLFILYKDMKISNINSLGNYLYQSLFSQFLFEIMVYILIYLIYDQFNLFLFYKIFQELNEINNFMNSLNKFEDESILIDNYYFRETNQLMLSVYNFKALVEFQYKISNDKLDLQTIEKMLEILMEIKNQGGLQLVYEKLIKIMIRKTYFSEAIFFNKLLINLLQKQKQKLNEKNKEISYDQQKKIDNKIFQNSKKILSLIIKNLKFNKKYNKNDNKLTNKIYYESIYILKEIIEFQKQHLNIQELNIQKLKIKKSQVLLQLRKIKEADISINEVKDQLYEYNKQKNFVGSDKVIFGYIFQKIYYMKGQICIMQQKYYEAAQYFKQCIADENQQYFKVNLKQKCFLKLKNICMQLNDVQNSVFFENLHYFYSQDKRDFMFFIINQSQQANNNLNEIINLVKKIIVEKLKPNDSFTFFKEQNKEINSNDEQINNENSEFINKVFIKKYLSKQQQCDIFTHLYTEYSVQDLQPKNLIDSIILAYDKLLSDFRASNKSKYLIFICLNDSKVQVETAQQIEQEKDGNKNRQQNEQISYNDINKIKKSFFNLLLIGNGIKTNQHKNSFFTLSTSAKRSCIVDMNEKTNFNDILEFI